MFESIAEFISTLVFLAAFAYGFIVSMVLFLEDDSRGFWEQIAPHWQFIYGGSMGIILANFLDILD